MREILRACGADLGKLKQELKEHIDQSTPRLEEGEISLDVRRLPSISLTEAQRLGRQVEDVLAKFPEVTSVVSRTGRPEVPTDPVGFDGVPEAKLKGPVHTVLTVEQRLEHVFS